MISLYHVLCAHWFGGLFCIFSRCFWASLLGTYVRAVEIVLSNGVSLFFFAFTVYAYFAGGVNGIKTFLEEYFARGLDIVGDRKQHCLNPRQYGGSQTHWSPSGPSGGDHSNRRGHVASGRLLRLSAILKIALLFGLFHLPFTAPLTTFTVPSVLLLLSGSVMSGIQEEDFWENC